MQAESTALPRLFKIPNVGRAAGNKKSRDIVKLCAAHGIPIIKLGPRSRYIRENNFNRLLESCAESPKQPQAA